MGTAVAEVLKWHSLADALIADYGESRVAQTQLSTGVPESVGDQFAHVGSWFLATSASHEEAFRTSAAFLQVPDLSSSTNHTFLSIPSSSFGADTLQETGIPALAILAWRVGLTTISFSDSAVRTGSIVRNTLVVDPGGSRKTLLREWLALIALLVISVGAVSSVGNTGCSVPLGSLGASIRGVHALFSVEEFPWQTPVTWIGTDALSSVEEGVGRTADVDT